ncbi:unnamed protein product, partial [Brugia pahangi]|uniref:PXA domain-containing protein n=1 Tax=Brugia pahangi TaxID=6280 RepID=A0A0N4TGF9_BRUPA
LTNKVEITKKSILIGIFDKKKSFFHKYLKSKYFRNRRMNLISGVTISESVDKLLEELIEQLIDNYINRWYKTKISGDAAFINEIRYQIRYAVAILYLRFQKIDLSSTILFEMYSSQLIETKILEAMPDVHFALSSRQNEVDYLRELADHLIGLIMDENCIAGHSNDSDSPSRNILANHSVLLPVS